MKRANGSGSVVRHNGCRRRPYEVRITAEHGAGRQVCRSIGWYESKDEAMAALIAYNKSPYDVNLQHITLAGLFDRWYAHAVEQNWLAKATLANIKSAYFRRCTAFADFPYSSLRAHHMQCAIDDCIGAAAQTWVKNLFYHLDNFADTLDIVGKRCSHLLHTSPVSNAQKTIFSEYELARLWENADAPNVDTVLILLYSGWRISEFLNLIKDDIYIDTTGKTISTMRGGIKTKAGKGRIVPIHSAILPLVKRRYEHAKYYLIGNRKGNRVDVCMYRQLWHDIMRRIGARHTCHEARHTFRSWLDAVSAPLSCVNRIMGHTCGDIGLQVYTHNTIVQLASAIELIPNPRNVQRRETASTEPASGHTPAGLQSRLCI